MEFQLEERCYNQYVLQMTNLSVAADTKKGLQRIMNRLSATAEECGMKINTKRQKS